LVGRLVVSSVRLGDASRRRLASVRRSVSRLRPAYAPAVLGSWVRRLLTDLSQFPERERIRAGPASSAACGIQLTADCELLRFRTARGRSGGGRTASGLEKAADRFAREAEAHDAA